MKKFKQKLVRKVKVFFNNLTKSDNFQKEINYKEYIDLQIRKTSDKDKIEKWLGPEWDIKLSGFREIFSHHSNLIKNSEKALLIGSRTGQEVAAIREMDINAIGIDLVEFPPYTVKGDVHKMDFKNAEFDFAFSNILDHILNPKIFYAELNRVLKIKAHVIFHIFKGSDIDEFSVNYIYNLNDFIAEVELFGFKLIQERKIKNTHDKMNIELIFLKQEDN